MEGEKILMSQRQLQRLEVMGLVEAAKITLKEGRKRLECLTGRPYGFERGFKRKEGKGSSTGIREIRRTIG
jgi:hypothetical protein